MLKVGPRCAALAGSVGELVCDLVQFIGFVVLKEDDLLLGLLAHLFECSRFELRVDEKAEEAHLSYHVDHVELVK